MKRNEIPIDLMGFAELISRIRAIEERMEEIDAADEKFQQRFDAALLAGWRLRRYRRKMGQIKYRLTQKQVVEISDNSIAKQSLRCA